MPITKEYEGPHFGNGPCKVRLALAWQQFVFQFLGVGRSPPHKELSCMTLKMPPWPWAALMQEASGHLDPGRALFYQEPPTSLTCELWPFCGQRWWQQPCMAQREKKEEEVEGTEKRQEMKGWQQDHLPLWGPLQNWRMGRAGRGGKRRWGHRDRGGTQR